MFKRNQLFFHLSMGLMALFAHSVFAQQPIPLNDLSAFTTKPDNWKIVGNASADISKENSLTTTPHLLTIVVKFKAFPNDPKSDGPRIRAVNILAMRIMTREISLVPTE